MVLFTSKGSGTANHVAWLGAGQRNTSAFGAVSHVTRGLEVRAAGGKQRAPPREQNALGRPPPTPSTGEPTHRVPRRGAPQNKGTPLSVTAGWEGRPLDGKGGDMSLLTAFLQTLGLPQEVVSQVGPLLAPRRSLMKRHWHWRKPRLDRFLAQKNKLGRTPYGQTAGE